MRYRIRCPDAGGSLRLNAANPRSYLRRPAGGAARHNVDIGSDLGAVAVALLVDVFDEFVVVEPNMEVMERPPGKPWRSGRVENIVRLLTTVNAGGPRWIAQHEPLGQIF